MNSQTVELFSQNSIGLFDNEYLHNNCEVAKVETSTVHRPTITFNPFQVYVSATLLNCVPEMNFVQFLIDRASKKLILQPCNQQERDAVQLRTKAVKPRHITSKEFSRRLFEYMQWDFNYRYKVVGNVISGNDKTLAVFDLTSANKYELTAKKKSELQKIYAFTSRLGDSFGVTVREHSENPLIAQFKEDAMLSVKEETPVEHDSQSDNVGGALMPEVSSDESK